MCRIAGYVGPASNSRKVSIILRGLVMAEEKGNPHGTGIVIRNLSEEVNYVSKKGIRGRDFLVRGYADFLWERKYNYAFVHVRYMTSGEQSDRCSHPFGFRVNGIWHFGMHNGVFSDTLCDKISEQFGCSKAKVDSETFFWAIQELQNNGKSLEDAIAEVTEFISAEGEFAFAYMAPDAVYLWRSEGRPLVVFDMRENNLGRWFASTKDMMQKALKISGVDLKEKVTYFELKPFKLYKLGHKTNPAWEVEPIRELPRKEKPKPSYPLWSAWQPWREREARQEKLFDSVYGRGSARPVYSSPYTDCRYEIDDTPPVDDNYYDCDDEIIVDPECLSDEDLKRTIKDVSKALKSGELDGSYECYLSELIYERESRKLGRQERRKERRKNNGGNNKDDRSTGDFFPF